MQVFAIDPGSYKSAFVVLDKESQVILQTGIEPNDKMIEIISAHRASPESWEMAIEMVACYGMPVGAEVFETCVWIGRFVETWKRRHHFVYRKDVKLHLCNSSRAKDPNIRQALINRYGIPGTKKNPGKLYGISSHLWAALAVAVYHSDTV